MSKKILCLLLLCFLTNTTYSLYYKRSQIDSLKQLFIQEQGNLRIEILLDLARTYVYFELDTAQIYVDMAKSESVQMGFEWGICQSYLIKTDIDFHKKIKSLKEIKFEQDRCIDWLSRNGYELDALKARIGRSNTILFYEGQKTAFEESKLILKEAKRLGDTSALGGAWGVVSKTVSPMFDRDLYSRSSDSSLYYWNIEEDSMRIVSYNYAKLFNLHGGIIPGNEIVDLERIVKNWGNPTLHTRLLIYQAYPHIVNGNIDSSNFYLDQIAGIVELSKSNLMEVTSTHFNAVLYRQVGEMDKAIACYKDAEEIYKACDSHEERKKSLYFISQIYMLNNDYQNAIKYFIQTLELCKLLNDDYLATSVKRNLGDLYVITGEMKRAENLYTEAAEWGGDQEDNQYVLILRGNLHNSIGDFYRKEKKYAEAINYYKLSIDNFEGRPNRFFKPKVGLLTLFLDMNDLERADSMCLAMRSGGGLIHLYRNDLFHLQIGRLFLRQGQFKDAVSSLNTFFDISNGLVLNEDKCKAYQLLYHAEKKLGHHDEALKAFESFKSIEDSLQSGEVLENVGKIQSEFEISLREREIKDLQQQKELSDLRLNQQDTQLELRQLYISILVFIVIFVGVIGYLLFRRFKNKKEKDVLEMKAKRIELELENTQSKQKAELAEVKNTIFANVSHEFRTPLTLIQVPIKNQLAKANDADKVVFNSVLKNTNQLLKMVDELLDLAKIETGTVSLHKSPFHLEQFFLQVKTNFSFAFREKNIEFIVENNVSNQNFIADENRLKIVINNLLKNALSHTPNGGKVACFVRRDGDTLLIEVHNTGKTIPEHELRLIFDRHYRGRSAKYIGNGIGLSVSQQIIELHKGRIIAKNNGNEGVVFNVTIPGKFSVHEKIGAVAVKEEGEIFVLDKNEIDKNKEKANKPTILIVEDNVEMMDLLQSILSSEFDLSIAMDGVEGEELALDLQPDLILSDIMMPKKDGIELLSSLKSNIITSHIPVVLLTAKADVESRISGFDQNADDYINKPFDAKELKARIFNILRQREKLQKLFTENPFLRTKDIKCTPLDAEFLEKAVTILEKHYADGDFAVIDFCKELALNRNSVHNKIKAFTNQTTSEYIKNFRLEKAIRLLVGSNNSITHIYMDVGFNSPQAFNKAFKRRYNCTPTEYRKQNSKKAI